MTLKNTTTRRHILAGGAALAASPVLAAVPAFAAPAAKSSVIAQLWAKAEALKGQMLAHGAEIARGAQRSGLPGWMVASGPANALGNSRYDTLVRILQSKPAGLDDLAIVGKATVDHDMQNGPKSWAHAQFDCAARNCHSAAFA